MAEPTFACVLLFVARVFFRRNFSVLAWLVHCRC